MMLIRSYLNYVLHDVPTHPTPTGFEVVDEFPQKLAKWAIIFTLIFMSMKFVYPRFYPEWYAKLSERKKREFPSYVICTIHHFFIVPIGWYHLYNDMQRTEEELAKTHYAELIAGLVPFIFGYFLADLLCFAIPDFLLKGNVEFLLHHALTVYLLGSVMIGSGHMLRFAAHLIVCDTANLFFSIAWLMRTSDTLKEWSVVTVFEMLFVICYFFHRVINLPLALYTAYRSPLSLTMGYGRFTFLPIVLLQWFWFYKIIVGLSSRGEKKKKEKEEKKGNVDADNKKAQKKND